MGLRLSLNAAVTSPDSGVHSSGQMVTAPGSSKRSRPDFLPWEHSSRRRAWFSSRCRQRRSNSSSPLSDCGERKKF